MTATKLGQTNEEFDLFTHVEDQPTRIHNQANFMANMFEDHTTGKNGVVNTFGATRIIKYFSQIPKQDQKQVLNKYKDIMVMRGFKEVECL